MKNLKIEWMKIKNYRVFQVFSVLYMLGIIVIIYIFYKIYMQITGRIMSMGNPNPEDGRDIFDLFFSSQHLENSLLLDKLSFVFTRNGNYQSFY